MRCAWEAGQRVTKLIGFDATEDHRTFAGDSALKIVRQPDLPEFKDRYHVRYPLREWGIDRERCARIILDEGLPLPPKSACFFCKAMGTAEIQALAAEEPDLYEMALLMERRYRSGPHFKGDGMFKVTAKHKVTGETHEEYYPAETPADARTQFRTHYRDTGRPFSYKLQVTPCVVGLSSDSTWQEVPVGAFAV